MKVTSERLENCQVRVTVELEPAEIEAKLRQTARQVSNKYTVPGYRKGKAPYAAVLRMFGRELLQQQALEDFGDELYEQALEQIEYEAYEPGELEKVEWDPFHMEILVPIRPELDLGDYRAIRLSAEPKAVTDEDVERYLEELRQQHAQWVPVERPAAYDDRVVLDIEGRADGEVVLGNQGRELILSDGAHYPVLGFHEQIVGMSPGEEKTFVLTYPEDEPREDLAGQEVTFDVRLVTVNEQDIPPLDDDLALMVGDYQDLDALRASVHQKLEEEARQQAEGDFPERVLEAIIEQAPKIEFPPRVVDKELDVMLEQMENNLAARGLRLDAYLAMVGQTRDGYKQGLRPSATERVRRNLVMTEIVQLEGLKVEGEELQAELDRLAASPEFQTDELQELLATPGARVSVLGDMLVARARERIAQIARGEAPPLETPSDTEPAGEDETVAEAAAEDERVAEAAAEGEAAGEPEPDEMGSEAAEEMAFDGKAAQE